MYKFTCVQVTMASFQVGKLFSDYNTLQDEIQKFESENFVKLYKKESRTIEAAKKRCPNKRFSPDIKYSEVAFACVHNGKYKPNVTTGNRPNQKTNKTGCEFVIKTRATADGQQLMVTHYVNTHNHDVTSEEYQMNPAVRKLTHEAQEEVKNMCRMNGNRKLIQQYYADKTGKTILLRDIHNLASQKLPSLPCPESSSDVKNLADWLKETHPGIDHHFTIDESGVVQGIYLQDEQMKRTFQKFPEVILADSTHKTNDRDMPFFALLTIDGYGDSHIVAAFLVNHEDEQTLTQMLKIFQEKNPASAQTKVVITDKDMSERITFKSVLPDVELQICLFHVLRTFGRECTTEKLGITSGERQTVLSKLQELAYAASEQQRSPQTTLCVSTLTGTGTALKNSG